MARGEELGPEGPDRLTQPASFGVAVPDQGSRQMAASSRARTSRLLQMAELPAVTSGT